MHEASVAYVLVRSQVMMIVILGYQFYLAVGSEMIDDALKNVERISSWPIQALNIGLFVLVLGICWLYLKSTRADLAKLQTANENERKEYIDSLKTMVSDMGKIIERNNVIFDRIDKRLERIERAADISPVVR
jgi:Tfp pilus assembly protein PilO